MRIAVDARELAGRPTGVGRYLSELLREWRATGVTTRHDVSLYGPAVPEHIDAAWRGAFCPVPGAGGTRWEQWDFARALRRDRPDVLFAPGYTAPLASPVPVALSVHDLSFFAHPEWYAAREGRRRRHVTAWSARRARVVLTPSVFSATELERFVGPVGNRVRVVPLGVRRPEATASAGPPRGPSVLYVGSLFQRRRIDVLLHAFAGLVEDHPAARLDVVGENRTSPRVDFAAMVAGHGLGAHVVFRHWVDDAALEQLYQQAAVFVFLSQYEGFGFTPLEAMARGVVPVVLDTAVAREVYGEAAVRLAETPSLVQDLRSTLDRLLSDEAARAPYLAAAPCILTRYGWPETAARTLAAIEEAAGA